MKVNSKSQQLLALRQKLHKVVVGNAEELSEMEYKDRKQDEEESEVVFLKEVTAKEASLSYCTSCKKCATLNSTEKSF